MKDIKLFLMDVDGTLTDGKIYMGISGEVFKAFDIKDGYGIHEILPKYGIVPVIITGRKSEIVVNRAAELGISEIHQGYHDKRAILETILEKYRCSLREAAYIGDDVLDIQCMKPIKDAGGLIGCPADAVDEVKALADYISDKEGGRGAVRDFIEWLTVSHE